MQTSSSSYVIGGPLIPYVRYPDLKGRRVFVTGGGSGIGAALVEAFVQQEAYVAFVDIAEKASAALVERLAQSGPRPWWRSCDVSDVDDLSAALGEAAAALGDFHVLINNVGSDDRHELAAVTPAYWDQRIAINERAAFFAIQAALPGMQRLGGGSIINMGSTGWKTKASGYPCYAMAKASMNGLTRGLARELGAQGVRINVLSPGWVMTERQQRLWLNEDSERDLLTNQCLASKVMPEDIASMALFLASDASRACTAQEFVVDAGWT